MATYGTFLIMAFSMVVIAMTANVVEGRSVGVNWGRQTSQKLLPSMVVDMCLSNGIEKFKLFSVNDAVLRAFSKSDIELMVNIPNVDLLFVNTTDRAKDWVLKNLKHHITERNVTIRYLGVTVEPFSLIETDRGDKSFSMRLAQYLRDINDALNSTGLADRVMLVMPHATDVLKPVSKPSEGDFRDDLRDRMIEVLKELHKHGAPFVINIYPLHSVIEEGFPYEFGMFDKKHDVRITDGNAIYDNIFDLKYDTLVWALRKNGFGDMKIIVGQVGWPTDGHIYARVGYAKRFYDGLLDKIAKDRGTPLQPGLSLDVYIHSLVDENQRFVARGPIDRHYGIYNYDGTAKFNIDFTLQGRDILPESAKGVSYLPQRWCILNKDAAKGKSNLVEMHYTNVSCVHSDCTRLAEGATCGYLKYEDKVSYAFNIHFQQSNQDISGLTKACHFDGLGKVVTEPPVFENCTFPVQILSTLFINSISNREMEATLGRSSYAGHRFTSAPGLIIILPVLLIFFA